MVVTIFSTYNEFSVVQDQVLCQDRGFCVTVMRFRKDVLEEIVIQSVLFHKTGKCQP